MELSKIKNKLNSKLYIKLEKRIKEFRPSQKKAINSGLLDNKNLLGKDLVRQELPNIYNQFVLNINQIN